MCFVDCRATFYSNAVFFCGKVFFFLQDPIFPGIFWIFRGLFELDLLQ